MSIEFQLSWMPVAENSFKELPWGALDDVVMGGVSQSTFQIDRTGGENGGPTGLFKGLFLSSPVAYAIFCYCFSGNISRNMVLGYVLEYI